MEAHLPWRDVRRKRLELRERKDRDRRILLAVMGAAFVAALAYGVLVAKSGPELIGVVLGTGLIYLVETWALAFVAGKTLESKPATWRVAALSVVTVALVMGETLVLGGTRRDFGAVIATLAAECFVLGVIAQTVLPATFRRAIVIAILARLLAQAVYLAILLALVGAILALMVGTLR